MPRKDQRWAILAGRSDELAARLCRTCAGLWSVFGPVFFAFPLEEHAWSRLATLEVYARFTSLDRRDNTNRNILEADMRPYRIAGEAPNGPVLEAFPDLVRLFLGRDMYFVFETVLPDRFYAESKQWPAVRDAVAAVANGSIACVREAVSVEALVGLVFGYLYAGNSLFLRAAGMRAQQPEATGA